MFSPISPIFRFPPFFVVFAHSYSVFDFFCSCHSCKNVYKFQGLLKYIAVYHLRVENFGPFVPRMLCSFCRDTHWDKRWSVKHVV